MGAGFHLFLSEMTYFQKKINVGSSIIISQLFLDPRIYSKNVIKSLRTDLPWSKNQQFFPLSFSIGLYSSTSLK